MLILTQNEFDALTAVTNSDGYCLMPEANYSQVKVTGGRLVFPSHCIFADRCNFGVQCEFGDDAVFGSDCTFGVGCSFGTQCRFYKGCWFGAACTFDEYCRFGAQCEFAGDCEFEEYCEFENKGRTMPGRPFVMVDGARGRSGTFYIFNFLNGMWVRDGGTFQPIKKFKKKLKRTLKRHESVFPTDLQHSPPKGLAEFKLTLAIIKAVEKSRGKIS